MGKGSGPLSFAPLPCVPVVEARKGTQGPCSLASHFTGSPCEVPQTQNNKAASVCGQGPGTALTVVRIFGDSQEPLGPMSRQLGKAPVQEWG